MAKKVTVIPANQINKKSNNRTQKKKIRAAAYCRVSTDQEEQLGSFANQVEYYTNYINSNPDYEMAGIFADEGISGTGTKKRTGFMEMIKACEEGKVDLVITKSISRFARNTQDCLNYSRKLKNMGIPIIFEKESINTMDATGELLFTILSSLAQEESRNISENTSWGIRSKFQKGIPHLNADNFMGYDKDSDGHLVINEDQAKVVKRIFQDFMEGWNLSEIAKHLNDDGVPGVHGESKWCAVTIRRMLQNEKYKGDLLMQKTYTADFLTKLQEENDGSLEQYFVEDNHEAIIDRDTWEAAQLELLRIDKFKKVHKIKDTGSCTFDPFFSKVFCGNCSGKYIRKYWTGIKAVFWKCTNAEKAKGCTCLSDNIREEALRKAVVVAWNSLVENREEYIPAWEKCICEGDPLQRLRGRQMIELTAEGTIEEEITELTRMVLTEIIVKDKNNFTVVFMDGTKKNVSL